MKREDKLYRRYLEILREELTPAMGCTEPIAVAYAAAKARELLGEMPESVLVQASGSIIKNVKSVIVPNTGGRRGIPVAAAAGILFGRADSALEVLAEATEGDIAGLDPFLEKTDIQVQYLEEGHVFDLKVSLRKGAEDSLCPHYGPSYQNHADGEERQNAFGSDAEGDRGWNTGAKGSLLHGADL